MVQSDSFVSTCEVTTHVYSYLNKNAHLVNWSSLVHPWFVLGFSLVFDPRKIRKEQENRILRKVLFKTIAAAAYIVL